MTHEQQVRGTHVPVFLPGDGYGVVRAWFVKEGDKVTKGQKLAEVVPRERGDYEQPSEDAVVSEHTGIVGMLDAKLGQFIEGRPIADIIIDQVAVECFTQQSPKRRRRPNKHMGKNHKKYDTSAISESITQLQRKRRDVENTIAKLDVAAEKDFYKEVLDEIDEHICAKRIEMLNMYKELKLKEQRRFNSGYLPFSLPRIEYERLTKDIPRWVVEPAARVRPKKTLMLASDEIEQPKSFRDIFYGYATSTYPFMEYKNSRDGDPICDQFRAMLAPRNTIVAMADGCNWGNAPAEAARRATKGFIDLIHRERERITDTNRLCNLFLSGLCAAHNAIIKGDDPDRLIGTTTLMGGMVLQLVGDEQETPAVVPDEEDDNDDDTPVVVSAEQLAAATPPAAARHWAFVLASVGDCKAFQFRTKTREIIELTPNSRNENACDATDCGGRLGPYIDGGPDLRNIGVFVSRCDEDDIVFICSDGVHDNFDPQHFGLSPREFGIDAEQWQDGEPEQVNAVKAKYRSARMLELLGDADVTPELITTRFINFCIDTTRSSQEFMQQNLGKKLPSDYTRFPGKMDHTTLIALRVREVSEQDISDARSPTNIDEQDSSASSTTTTTKQRPSSASVPIATASTTTDPSSSSSSPLSMSPTSTTIPIASATSADQQPPPSAKASDSIDRNTSLIRLSKSAALSIRTLVAKAKEGANLDEFAVAVNDSVAHTTALVELLSSFEEPQDVSMLTALSAKTIATAKKLHTQKDELSSEDRAAQAALLDKLVAGVATVIKKVVNMQLPRSDASAIASNSAGSNSNASNSATKPE